MTDTSKNLSKSYPSSSYKKTTHKRCSTLSILSWNIENHKSKEGNKFLDREFLKNFYDSDIVCLQETKGSIKLSNYVAFNSCRNGSKSGGVAILHKREYTKGISRFHSKITPDAVIAKLDKGYFHLKSDIFIVSFYISPANSNYRQRQDIDPWESLDKLITSLKNKGEIILCTDTNARIGTNADYILDTDRDFHNLPIQLSNSSARERNNSDKITNSSCDDLIDLTIANDMHILNGRTCGDIFGKKTYFCSKGTSTIDYIIVSKPIQSLITEFTPKPFTLYSDHRPLQTKLRPRSFFFSEINEYVFEKLHARFKWSDDKAKDFTNALNGNTAQSKFLDIAQQKYGGTHTESQNLSEAFTAALIDVANASLDKTKTTKKLPLKKWFSRDCITAKRELKKSVRRMNSCIENLQLRQDFFSAKRNYKRTIEKNKRDFRANLNSAIENGKILDWKNFKYLQQFYEEPEDFDNHDLSAFYEFFNKLYGKAGGSQTLSPSQPNQTQTQNENLLSDSLAELNDEISITEIKITIGKLKPGKSVAEDLISNEMLKSLNTNALHALCNVFNSCMASGTYPWHNSIISPIHKSGDRYNPDNYRAIAVGSNLGKLFSTILLNRLIQFRKLHCDDPINQLGFCKNAQTNDHILTLKTIIDKYRKKHKTKLFACFVDLRKAFDTVSREYLLYKITNLNIRGNFFNVLQNMYDNSTAKIKLNRLLSPKINIEQGTEQGHPMSPELFKIYLMDLSPKFQTDGNFPYLLETLVNHLLWADDLVLLSLDEIGLQNNLDILFEYCNEWGLSINYDKTKIITFGVNKCAHVFSIDGNTLKIVDRYCYLGIVIHKSGSFSTALDELRKKATRGLFGLKKSIMRTGLSNVALFNLFDALIKPILLYSCQVIAPHTNMAKHLATVDTLTTQRESTYLNILKYDTYEKFHLRFIKWACGVHRKTSNIAIWGDTGRYPLIFNAIKLAIDYFERVALSSPDTLIRKSFEEQRNLNLEWYTNTSAIIDKFGTGRSPLASTNAMYNMHHQFVNDWQNGLTKSTKLDFYKSIKQDFKSENYLKIANFDARASVCKLRTSSHNLEIEVGRYTNPITPRNDRVCAYCLFIKNEAIVESESHVLTQCPLYSIPRNTFSRKIDRDIINVLKEPLNKSELLCLGSCCKSIFDIHDSFSDYIKSNFEEISPNSTTLPVCRLL